MSALALAHVLAQRVRQDKILACKFRDAKVVPLEKHLYIDVPASKSYPSPSKVLVVQIRRGHLWVSPRYARRHRSPHSSSSTSMESPDWPFAPPASFFPGIVASLSIICLDTDTMLSSISCWPTSAKCFLGSSFPT